MVVPELLLSPLLSEQETLPWTTPGERSHAATFGSARRRAEYLTWRALGRRRPGPEVRSA